MNSMRALVWTEAQVVELREHPTPEAGPGDVRIRLHHCGICGSDMIGYLGLNNRRVPPLVLGHEFAGYVDQVGADVTGIREGDLVTGNPLQTCGACRWCRGGQDNLCPDRKLLSMHLAGAMADYIVIPAETAVPLPADLGPEKGAQIEPFANIYRMFHRWPEPPESMVIIGSGAMGLCAVRMAELRQVPVRIILDVNEDKLTIASESGATTTLMPQRDDIKATVEELTNGEGVAVVVDAVGMAETGAQGLSLLRPGGELILLGLHTAEASLDRFQMIPRELTVAGTYGYSAQEFRESAEYIIDGRIDFSPWVRTSSLETGQDTFQTMLHNPGATYKFMFQIQ